MPLSKNPDTVREGALVSSGLGGEGTRAVWDAPELLGNQAPRQRVDFLGPTRRQRNFSTVAKTASVRSSGYPYAQ